MQPFHGRTETTRDDWQTPIEIVRALGTFDLDPCANVMQPNRCAHFGYTEQENGLTSIWFGRVYVNPPYGRDARKWMQKLGEHGNGIALIPPRMGADWFQRTVLDKADAILFIRGRISFINPLNGQPVDGNNADSCLVAYGGQNVEALRQCGLNGRLWIIRNAPEPLQGWE